MSDSFIKPESIEIERKFLVTGPIPDLQSCRRAEIRQAYIATNPVIRLRQSDGDYFLTVKGSGGLVHTEFEMALTVEQFRYLWEKAEAGIIVKTRYEIPLGQSLVAELDVYRDNLVGYTTVEVEFPNLAAAEDFVPPAWFGCEVTGDKRYYNHSLAMFGWPTNAMSE